MLATSVTSLSADNTQVELRIIPNTHGPVTSDDIHTCLTQPDFAKLCPNTSAIANAVDEINGIYNQPSGDHELFFIIANRKDGKVSIEVSDDKMSASMTLTSAWGGTEVTLTTVLKTLKEHNIKMGLSKPKILALIQSLAILPPGETRTGNMAKGKPAINGKNAYLVRKVPLARERLLQPQERADGSVDMRNLGSMITVKPNDILMVKHPVTEGVEGYNVHGDKLLPTQGKDVALIVGDGTAIAKNNPHHLLAIKSGQPVETQQGMQVDDTLQIKNVDVNYGHVNFQGSVLITGDVQEGMHVKATGDVTVMGFVDSANIEAKGDVIVSKGIIGRQIKESELSTTIKAKGQICAQFVQYSHLEADGNILVTKQLLHSQSYSKQTITVSDKQARRGDIVGGRAQAAKGIHAVAFGATAGTKTELYCAMDKELLKSQLKELEQSVKSLVVVGLDLEARLRKLPPKAQWQTDPGMIEQVQMMLTQKKKISAERAKEEQQQQEVLNEVNGYFNHYYIQASKHIFTNVEINLSKAKHRTHREHGPCIVKNINNEVQFNYNS
ncbi:DUF342 domain-containing protein [Shewanella intestini]|uniref:DUF342 domain-containing protein n=1 Tax=Shewanella intestini TaxID=2017544 RepID=A0ABS5I2T3_9GAMM|nr:MULTISPECIES: FapA family protein [Shewanella]MBR9728338.1 DUF342 domain-containing protein [Shewanella intestini]MRG36680.1 DUF342 domain-containing protein [Shewanella sp. XMDDZSB0408]